MSYDKKEYVEVGEQGVVCYTCGKFLVPTSEAYLVEFPTLGIERIYCVPCEEYHETNGENKFGAP